VGLPEKEGRSLFLPWAHSAGLILELGYQPRGVIMNYLISAIAFVSALVILSTAFEYWQNRMHGQSHDDALHDTFVAGTFLSGSAIFSYIVSFIV
jgi:hypothetical protein